MTFHCSWLHCCNEMLIPFSQHTCRWVANQYSHRCFKFLEHAQIKRRKENLTLGFQKWSNMGDEIKFNTTDYCVWQTDHAFSWARHELIIDKQRIIIKDVLRLLRKLCFENDPGLILTRLDKWRENIRSIYLITPFPEST